jgi:phage-related protein
VAQKNLVPGQKPLYWEGSAKKDLLSFPEPVRDYLGIALSVAQFGGKHSGRNAIEGRR